MKYYKYPEELNVEGIEKGHSYHHINNNGRGINRMETIIGLALFIAFVGSLLLAYYSGKAEGSKESNKLADWEKEELATAKEDVKNLKNAVDQLKARIHDERSKTDIYVELLSKDDRRADKAVKASLAKAEAYINKYAEENVAAAFSQSVIEGRFGNNPIWGSIPDKK